ncbi:MAG TPA: tetratricopeptide repeat protein [Candidatus Acidoferrales bacterium]
MGRTTLFAVLLAMTLAISSSAHQTPTTVSAHEVHGSAGASSSYNIMQASPSAAEQRGQLEMRADIMMARKEFPTAVTVYMQVLNLDPKNAEIMNKIGVAYQQIGDLDRSGRFYKRAIHANKDFASAVNNYGTVEYEKKHYGKSITLYKRAIVLRPELPTLYSNLGYAYFCNKEYPEALKSFEDALALDPTVFDRKANGGTVVQQRSTPDPGLFYFFVAKSYAQRGDAERSAHYLKLARDDGYPGLLTAQTDPAFAKVIKDPGVQEVLHVAPAYATTTAKKTSPTGPANQN